MLLPNRRLLFCHVYVKFLEILYGHSKILDQGGVCSWSRKLGSLNSHEHGLLAKHSYIGTLHIEEMQVNVAISYLYF